MPRGNGKPTPLPVQQQRQLLFDMLGGHEGDVLRQWDPKAGLVLEALLGIVDTGAVVLLRPGSGGRALGIAIWEGDVRHPAKWLYESAELDEWALVILKRIGSDISQAAD